MKTVSACLAAGKQGDDWKYPDLPFSGTRLCAKCQPLEVETGSDREDRSQRQLHRQGRRLRRLGLLKLCLETICQPD
jgi:hypothetical protein